MHSTANQCSSGFCGTSPPQVKRNQVCCQVPHVPYGGALEGWPQLWPGFRHLCRTADAVDLHLACFASQPRVDTESTVHDKIDKKKVSAARTVARYPSRYSTWPSIICSSNHHISHLRRNAQGTISQAWWQSVTSANLVQALRAFVQPGSLHLPGWCV